MAKSSSSSSQALSLVVVTAFCFLSLISSVHCQYLYVEGKVYCDTCRTSFETKLSEYMHGAKVRLDCRDRAGGHPTYSVEGVTDETGKYRLAVEGNHEEEICEVSALKSTIPDCSERFDGRDHARVLLTANNGITSATRFSNPLGFMKKESLPACADLLREMGLPSSVIR